MAWGWRSPATDEGADAVVVRGQQPATPSRTGLKTRVSLAPGLPFRKAARRCSMNRFNRLSMAAAALLLTASVAAAQPADGVDRKDFQVFKDVATSVERYTQFTIFDDVSASVEEGEVTLTGKVTMPYKANDIAKRVAKIDGVTGVRNQIEVLPVSQFDNELRYRIARS